VLAHPLDAAPLPPTVAARRNARIRAAAQATIPLILFVVALVPRLWAPDLAPFGIRQGAYVVEAVRRAPVGPSGLYRDLSLPPLAVADPVLRELPSPIVAWVALRGLLDALGAALVYLAARPLLGAYGATLAGLLYAASPAAWAVARDPAGSFAGVLAAAALVAAVKLVERPTLARGAVFGVLLGLLGRSVPPVLAVAAIGAATLAVGRASWKVGGLTALGLVLVAGPALFTDLDTATGELFRGAGSAWLADWLAPGGAGGPYRGVPEASWWPDLYRRVVGLLTLGVSAVACVATVQAARAGRAGLLIAPLWSAVALLVALVGPAVSSSPAPTSVGPSSAWPVDGAVDRAIVAAIPPLSLLLGTAVIARGTMLRRAGSLGLGLLLLTQVGALAWLTDGAERAAREQPAFAAQAADGSEAVDGSEASGAPGGPAASLRDWSALADAIRDAAERAGAADVVLLDPAMLTTPEPRLEALLRGSTPVRRLAWSAALPLARETVYVVLPGGWTPTELARPSSTVSVFTPFGADTGARIVTLRARPAADWLARARTISNGRFSDGSVLLGVARESSVPGRVELALYWSLPAVGDAQTAGERVRAAPPGEDRIGDPAAPHPTMAARRGGELIVQRASIALRAPAAADALVVQVLDGAGRPIRTADGAESLEVPLRSATR
jgi:hypothetical protein